MRILQLTVHLFPNVGGVETHLKDLTRALIKREFKVFVLAYQPLSTKTNWKIFEKEKNLTILRIPWIRGFFERLVSYPLLEFMYLVPGLLIMTPFILLLFRPNVIHAHGLSAAFPAVFWGKIFGIRKIISIHSFYGFPKEGLYHDFVRWLFRNSDFILSLSQKSNEEVKSLGVKDNKCGVFTYWIDLDRFNIKYQISNIKKELGGDGKFIVLFVGRLVEEKGIKQLLEAADIWDDKINLVVIGSGPLEGEVLKKSTKSRNIKFLGKVDQDDLPLYYSASDLTVVPSTSEEGFGRVIIESLACGTPVIASKRGATDEAMDESVGRFIEATPEDIKEAVEYFYKNPQKLKQLSENARQFAERRYSQSNVQTIIRTYTK